MTGGPRKWNVASFVKYSVFTFFLYRILLVDTSDLDIYEFLELLLGKTVLVLVKIKKALGDGRHGGLVLGVVVWLQVWVAKGFLDCDAFCWVEGQEFLQKIERQWIGVREHGGKGHSALEGQCADIIAGAARLDAIEIFHGGCSQHIQNQVQLRVVYLWRNEVRVRMRLKKSSRKQRLA